LKPAGRIDPAIDRGEPAIDRGEPANLVPGRTEAAQPAGRRR
jgi:hypothetical protein